MIDEARYRRELYIRIPRDADEAITRLAAIYGTRTAAVINAVLELDAKQRRESSPVPPEKPRPVKVVRGRRKGGIAPFGMRYDRERGEYVADPDEQDTLRRMLELDAQGKGQAEIRDVLNAEGRLAREGKTWATNRVDTILRTHRKRQAAS